MNRFTPSLLALATALLLSTPAVASATSPTTAAVQPAQDKASQLNALYEQYWEESLKLNPLRAAFQGDPRYNGQLPNFCSAFRSMPTITISFDIALFSSLFQVPFWIACFVS